MKFRKIPCRYYPQIPYILRPVGIVVLTDNTSKYKEFIVTCNTKTLLLAINDESFVIMSIKITIDCCKPGLFGFVCYLCIT